MFFIKEILIPRSSGSNLAPVAISALEDTFENTIKKAIFSFPYNPDKLQYVICVREEKGNDDFLLIINPETTPDEGELFVSIIDNFPVVRKYMANIHSGLKMLGTIAHASKAAVVNID